MRPAGRIVGDERWGRFSFGCTVLGSTPNLAAVLRTLLPALRAARIRVSTGPAKPGADSFGDHRPQLRRVPKQIVNPDS